MKLKDFLNKPEWKIAGLFYKVAWCKIIDEASTVGYCDDTAKVIYMKDQQELDETYGTLVHELVHAMDHTYSIKLRHSQVRKLELALAEFMRQNGLVK
jgi:Zn-dependent peptidase ImmA (M78 family)